VQSGISGAALATDDSSYYGSDSTRVVVC